MGKRTWFPQLHAHDEHSIKDGCSTVETYADIVQDLGGQSLAITNHGMAAGYARQFFACKERGIKPIFGMEAYINEHRLKPVGEAIKELQPKAKRKTASVLLKEKLAKLQAFRQEHFRPSPHALILAKTREGYRNLVRMSTDSYKRGYYYVPRTDTGFLEEHAEGLIYGTACIGGYIPKLARADFATGVKEAKRLQRIFGDDFLVELMITEYDAQRETNQVMMRLAHEIGARCILTCDVHYAKPSDSLAQDVLLLMRDDKTLADKFGGDDSGGGVWQFATKDLYWRTLEDVARTYRQHHGDYMDREFFRQAVRNTYDVAESIEHIDFDTSLKLPGVFANPEATLRELTISGMRWRIDQGDIPASGVSKRQYVDRLRRELNVINAKGFAEYFLILHDICDHARKIGARMGPGRGSAGGSLVAYLARITEIDPLRFNLLFERFLDVSRSDPPDIDLDFSPDHRDGIKEYVEKRYPATATIGAMSTFKPRATLQNVGRVFGIDYREMQKLTKPMGTDADGKSWDEIFDLWPEVEEFAEEHPKCFEVVRVLRGLISHRTKNAAGMLVAPASALDDVPMIYETNGQAVTAFPDSQGDGVNYKGREITRMGYLKMDILGVANLENAPGAADLLRREEGIEVDLRRLPLDDEETYEVAATGDVPGVFQLDTIVSVPVLKTVGADQFADLVMITALARPGPLKHAIHRTFSKLKNDARWTANVPHPDLVGLLEDSRGLMILQEDVMHVVEVLCGFSREEANALRKITSKKQPEAMKLWRDKFMEGGLGKGYKEEVLADTWEKIETFAGYGFCKAHAVAYMITAYQQLYMLAHHPLYYFASLLKNTERGKKTRREDEKIVNYMRAAMAREITVVGPDARVSSYDFDVYEGEITYGLGKIKGVASAAQAVIDARPFATLEEFHERVDKRKAHAGAVKKLIYAGAFDGLAFDPAAGDVVIPEEEGIEQRNGLALRYHQLRKGKADDEPEVHSVTSLMQQERELLGIALTWWASKEKNTLRELGGLETIAYHLEEDLPTMALLVEIARARTHKTKRGLMCFVSVADETGTLDNIVLWADQYKLYKELVRVGRIVTLRLRRKESHDPSYGKWSYNLHDRSPHGPPIEGAQRTMRRVTDA